MRVLAEPDLDYEHNCEQYIAIQVSQASDCPSMATILLPNLPEVVKMNLEKREVRFTRMICTDGKHIF